MRSIICISQYLIGLVFLASVLMVGLTTSSRSEICIEGAHSYPGFSYSLDGCDVFFHFSDEIGSAVVSDITNSTTPLIKVKFRNEQIEQDKARDLGQTKVVDVVWGFSRDELKLIALREETNINAIFARIPHPPRYVWFDGYSRETCDPSENHIRTYVHWTSDMTQIGEYTDCYAGKGED